MYTPIPKPEKNILRDQWRDGKRADFPRILEASRRLQDTLNCGASERHKQHVLTPWLLPHAVEDEFALDGSSSTFIGSYEAGWAIPGASEKENLVIGHVDDPLAQTGVDSDKASDLDSERDDQSNSDIDNDNEVFTCFQSSPLSQRSESLDTSSRRASSTTFLTASSGLVTSSKQIQYGTPFQTPKIKSSKRHVSIASTEITASSATSLSIPSLKHMTSPMSSIGSHYSPSMLRHIFINHNNHILNSAVSWKRALPTHLLDQRYVLEGKAPTLSYGTNLNSPLTFRSEREDTKFGSLERDQSEQHQAARITSPKRRVSSHLTKHPILGSIQGTTSVSTFLDLEALQKGELRSQRTRFSPSPGSMATDVVVWDHEPRPSLLWDSEGINSSRVKTKRLPPYWIPSLPQDIDYWLHCDDSETLFIELSSITFSSVFSQDTVPFAITLHEDAKRIRLISTQLPQRARGILTQRQPLDWVVIEICWTIPRIAKAVIAFPKECITASEEWSSGTLWKLLQAGSVPSAYGIGIGPTTFESFMSACALGEAIIKWEAFK